MQIPLVIFADFKRDLKDIQKSSKDSSDVSYTEKYEMILLAVMGKKLYLLIIDLVKQCEHIEAKVQFTILLKKMLKEVEHYKNMKKTLTMTYPSKKYLSKLLNVDSNNVNKKKFCCHIWFM